LSIVEKFLKIDGVVAAGEFTPDGKCKTHVGKLTKDNAEELARYSATLGKLFDMMGKMHKKTKTLDLDPYHGFVHCGGEYTLFVGSKYFAVADETVDWNEVSWASLMGKFPEGV
jgi:roadblock/LC7 domain-containing protein